MAALTNNEIKEAFSLFDPQNTGKVEPRVLQEFLDSMGDDELKSKVRIPTHPLDIKEFTAVMKKYSEKEPDLEEAHVRTFKAINKDGSGNISSQELKSAISSLLGANALSEADIDEIIHEGDVSGDGRLTIEEFLKIVQKSERKSRGEYVLGLAGM